MFRKALLSAAAAAALACVGVTAQAQVLVEIEGTLSAFTPTPGSTTEEATLTVMNNTVVVDKDTAFVTPTANRQDLFVQRVNGPGTAFVRNAAGGRYTVANWVRGDSFAGRTQRGLLGGTVIVTGTVDPTTGVITAEEVFSDVAENVILGAVYENQCSNPACNADGDYIRGNGPEGPLFVPNKDLRLPAGPITDAGLFKLDLQGKDLGINSATPATFGGEGYFSQRPVALSSGLPDDPATLTTDESKLKEGIVYWAFELGENRPDLLLNKGIPEISALRIRCTEGGRLEVRGFVHAPVNADGTAPLGGNFAPSTPNPTTGGQGRIRVVMNVNGVNTTFLDEDGAPPVADLPATYGVYRLRSDVTQCGTEATVYWDRGNTTISPWASVVAPVDRLREE